MLILAVEKKLLFFKKYCQGQITIDENRFEV